MNEPILPLGQLQPSWSERTQDYGKILLGWLYVAGIILLVAALFKGLPRIAGFIYPLTVLVGSFCLFVVLPLSLILAVFRKTRGVAGIAILLSSEIWAFGLWVNALLIAYALAGVAWLVIGVVFVGLGVIPVAIIAAMIKGHWSLAGQLVLSGILILIARFFAFFLAAKADTIQK